jgi:hypothetical protein
MQITLFKRFPVRFRSNHLLFAICLLFSFSTLAQSQEEDTEGREEEAKSSSFVSFDFGLDLQTRYIWRGLELGGASGSAQPYVELAVGQFCFGAWGAYSLGGINAVQEADLYVAWAPLDFLSFTYTNYFFPIDFDDQDYFEYGRGTGHVNELMVSFAGVKNFPIGIAVATNFAGADKTEDGEQSYSTYVELSYGHTIAGVDFNAFVGGVFADKGGYYLTDGAGIINVGVGGSKEIKITDSYSLPVNAALIFNPDAGDMYITFGISL